MFIFNGNKIKNRLEQLGWSQSILADKIDVNPATISNILNNKSKNISLKLAYDLCKTLNIEINELIINIEPMKITQDEIIERIIKLSKNIAENTTLLKLMKDRGYDSLDEI